jgi:transposase InsO family protein
MKRARSRSRIEKDAALLTKIQAIKADHPLWGYRRVWAYLRYRNGLVVGKNTICRIMKENALLVQKNMALRAKRTSTRPKPRAKVPNQYWGTDMTKLKIQGWGWLYVHIVIDWYTKEIIGYHASLTSKASDWLAALNMAVNARFPQGILDHKGKPKLISDNGCQPTSESFMKTCSQLKIKQIFTSWNNPKGNADTERFFRTLKEDLVWINDWDNPFEFQKDFHAWILAYNTDFPHQSLNHLTPAQFFDVYIKNRVARKELSSQKHSLILA